MPTATAVTTTTAIAAPPTTQSSRPKKWIDLDVGDCLAEPPPTDPSVVTVRIVDCATAHEAEVYFRAPMEVNAATADVANEESAAPSRERSTSDRVRASLKQRQRKYLSRVKWAGEHAIHRPRTEPTGYAGRGGIWTELPTHCELP